MTTLRAILIDDEFRGLNALKTLVENYCPDIRIVDTCTSPRKGIESLNAYRPEVVFLDINMPEMNGFEMLEQLEWKNFHLVFTTAHQEFALRALKLSALDYLLKPIDRKELVETVERITLRMKRKDWKQQFDRYNSFFSSLHPETTGKVKIHSRNSIEAVEPSRIVSLESRSNYTCLHMEDNSSYLSSKTLKEYEAILCSDNGTFMRVHNSFIINLRKVIRYIKSSESVVMWNDLEIPVSKSRRDIFLRWLEV